MNESLKLHILFTVACAAISKRQGCSISVANAMELLNDISRDSTKYVRDFIKRELAFNNL